VASIGPRDGGTLLPTSPSLPTIFICAALRLFQTPKR
jgi:hypothetical protein